MKPKLLKYVLWDILQFVFGADQAKQDLHFRVAPSSKDAKILDFACSTGNASAIFKDYHYTGLDIDSNAINYAQSKFRLYPNMRFVSANIFDFKPQEKFDYIIFGAAGHHIPNDEVIKIFSYFKNLLTPQGIIGIFDPVWTGNEGSLLNFFMKIDQGKFHKTFQEYEEIIDKSGLTVLEKKITTVAGPIVKYVNYAMFKVMTKR